MKRMSYETYAYLSDLLDREEQKIIREFQHACRFIPTAPPLRGQPSNIEKAHRLFQQECRSKITAAKEELHAAAASTYKDHPNIEMRKFWGIEQ